MDATSLEGYHHCCEAYGNFHVSSLPKTTAHPSTTMRSPAAFLILLLVSCCSALVVTPARPRERSSHARNTCEHALAAAPATLCQACPWCPSPLPLPRVCLPASRAHGSLTQ